MAKEDIFQVERINAAPRSRAAGRDDVGRRVARPEPFACQWNFGHLKENNSRQRAAFLGNR